MDNSENGELRPESDLVEPETGRLRRKVRRRRRSHRKLFLTLAILGALIGLMAVWYYLVNE